jgi:ADP-ribose pyrophosphatase
MTKTIYPDMPRVAVGAIVLYARKVLLVLRGKPPAMNIWASPGGSVQLGETLQAAAEREVLEETSLQTKAGEVIYTFQVIERDDKEQVRYHYVILDLMAEPIYPGQSLQPGDDARDARWFTWAELNQPHFPISEPTYNLLAKILPEL